jgi:formylglycine-generating enzyme required for sulfatase activity
MLRVVVLTLALLLSPSAFAQTPEDAAANRLFVEAVQLWNRAEGEPVADRAATLQRVQLNLKTIIERHGGSSLAVRLVIGETVGPLSVARVERAASAAAEAQARAAEAQARAAEAQARAAAARFKPVNEAAGVGRIFRDCPECPEMVVIPAGHAYLASGGDVMIAAPLAVGKFEVTFAEWDDCVAGGGCTHRPNDRPWGRGRQPVMNVSWDDVQQYVAWLSRRTGKTYRLLSEAEWEYAAQAGTGHEQVARAGANEANCGGCGSRWDKKQPAPVGSFAANAFGLHDMLGNVSEWTADCWDATRAGVASDGSARVTGDCALRVVRGASWNTNPGYTRSAHRSNSITDLRHVTDGFRVARTL